MESKWIVPMKQQPCARMRLFCFPYSGGSARVYKPWADKLPSWIEVCGVQYPGRGMRFSEPCITTMGGMVAAIHRAITPFLDKPCAFFGHSLGGGIALDVAKKLQTEGRPIKHLIISGRRAAHLPRKRKRVTELPETEFRKEVFEMGGMSKEIAEHPELMDLISPILRSDLSISEKYVFSDAITLNSPLTAFGGEDDPLVDKDSIPAWKQHTSSEFAYHFFPGAHFFIDSDRDKVLAKVAECLAD